MHEVKVGDSLWSLAKQYGVGVEALRSANGLENKDTIRTGQRLTIPVAPNSSKPAAAATPKPSAAARPSREQFQAAEALYSQPSSVPLPSTLEERAPAWVLARPGPSTQVEKSNAARGGIFPCAAPDPGFGAFQRWQQVAPMAHVLIPTQLQLNAQGEFDAVFHFHGRDPVRKEWVTATDNVVLIAVDVGIDSKSYSDAFSDPRTFGQVLRAVEAEVARSAGRTQSVIRRVGVSAWSAGYGALEQILKQPYPLEVIDAVVLLDGLHSGYTEGSLDAARLEPFVRFAQRAVDREAFMFVSHSSILTQGYASTTETAQYLTWKVGGKPKASSSLAAEPMGLERVSSYSQGDFHVRGFRGIGAADHCAHLGLLRDVLRVHIKSRWQAPLAPGPANDAPLAPGPSNDAPLEVSRNDHSAASPSISRE